MTFGMGLIIIIFLVFLITLIVNMYIYTRRNNIYFNKRNWSNAKIKNDGGGNETTCPT